MKTLLLIPIFLCLLISLQAQVAISSNNASPDSSAMLDVQSTDKGLLIPRMTSAQRMAIGSPAAGLLLYQTDGAKGLWFYDGAEWMISGVFTISGDVVSNGNGNYATNDFVFGSPSLDYDGNSNHRRRMFFDKDRSAFRAGYSNSLVWDADSIGLYSVAFGYDTYATNNNTISMGSQTIASGNNATALGSHTEARGSYSIALGRLTVASGASSTSMGYSTQAIGAASTSMGSSTQAIGASSTSMGSSTQASGSSSTSMGSLTQAKAVNSTSMGRGTMAHGYGSTVVGLYNDTIIAVELDNSSSTTPLFIVGNGSIGSPSNAMVVRKDGKVGIGTSVPDDRLHVSGGNVLFDNGGTTSGLTRKLTIGGARNDAGNAFAQIDFQNLDDNNGNTPYVGARISSENTNGSDDGDLRFATNNGTLTTRMILDEEGKMGIGNTAPIYDLHVGNGNISATNGSNTRMAVSDNTNGKRAAILGLAKTNGGSKVEAQLEANGGAIAGPSVIVGAASVHPLYLRTGNITRMVITTSGDVGVGTFNPAYKLEVTGDINALGTVYCSGVSTCSDKRFKYDISPVTNALSSLLKLQGVYYMWDTKNFPNKGFKKGRDIGVIAQEVEKVFPELVASDNDGYKSVDYSKLTAVLIESVKEQQQQIDHQQAEIEALKAQTVALISTVEKMNSLIEPR